MRRLQALITPVCAALALVASSAAAQEPVVREDRVPASHHRSPLSTVGPEPPGAALGAEAQRFVDAARAASARYLDPSAALRAGYRRVGPDFPGMGEHWVHLGRLMGPRLDPAQPAILSYTRRAGRSALVGVAFAVPLSPDESPPAFPFDPEVWHDHTGAVDEELLLIAHPSSMHGPSSGHRLAVVHVWTGVNNPAGILAQNNWALPFWRAQVAPPARPAPRAARALALAHDAGAYQRALIRRAAELSPAEADAVDAALDEASRGASRVLVRLVTPIPQAPASPARRGGDVRVAVEAGPQEADVDALASVWNALWQAIQGGVRPEVWSALAPLAGID